MNIFRRELKLNITKKFIRKGEIYMNLNNLIINVIKINDD